MPASKQDRHVMKVLAAQRRKSGESRHGAPPLKAVCCEACRAMVYPPCVACGARETMKPIVLVCALLCVFGCCDTVPDHTVSDKRDDRQPAPEPTYSEGRGDERAGYDWVIVVHGSTFGDETYRPKAWRYYVGKISFAMPDGSTIVRDDVRYYKATQEKRASE